jgi:glutathione peroxidase
MRQLTFFTGFFLLLTSCLSAEQNVHTFTVKDIDGKDKSLADFKGKVVLIVNVASKCGLTTQYEQLQKIHDKYSSKGFEIIGFPANNFGKQEPGTNKEIKAFCKAKYAVKFSMMSKIDVKGDNKHELYKFLTAGGKDISWNFEKFLIGPDGKIISRFKPKTKPDSKEIVSKIEEELSKLK